MPTRIFISYAKEDREPASRLYRDLQSAGLVPWIDFADLMLGETWETAIKQAIQDSDYFLALISSRSVGKTGFVQNELRHAMEISKRHPDGKIFIIVLRLDDCSPPFEDLRKLHWSDIFISYEETLAQLLRTFRYSSEEKPLLAVIPEEREGIIAKLTDKGFGFIHYSRFMPELFFHGSELHDAMYDELHAGDNLTFFIAEGPRGKVAVKIRRV